MPHDPLKESRDKTIQDFTDHIKVKAHELWRDHGTVDLWGNALVPQGEFVPMLMTRRQTLRRCPSGQPRVSIRNFRTNE